MGKLSILGAHRVKALIDILKEKQTEEEATLQLPTADDVRRIAEREFGILEMREQLEEMNRIAHQLAKKLETVTGFTMNASLSLYSYRNNVTDFNKRWTELKKELIEQPRKEIKEKYKEKENRLWLCETLEEAKKIVGIE